MTTVTLMGGLGNNCFQTAAVIAYAAKYKMPYIIPLGIDNPHQSDPQQYFFPKVRYGFQERTLPVYTEKRFEYDEIPYMPDIHLKGYFQSYKYFHDYRNLIVESFGGGDIVTDYECCAIHYRAGDYRLYPTIHPIVSRDYVLSATAQMVARGYSRFRVFSDEIEAIEDILQSTTFRGNVEFEYMERNTAISDLFSMAGCGSHIMSNSTFSWWGHYLCNNPRKIAIAPRKWFGEGMPHNTQDLMMPHFITL